MTVQNYSQDAGINVVFLGTKGYHSGHYCTGRELPELLDRAAHQRDVVSVHIQQEFVGHRDVGIGTLVSMETVDRTLTRVEILKVAAMYRRQKGALCDHQAMTSTTQEAARRKTACVVSS